MMRIFILLSLLPAAVSPAGESRQHRPVKATIVVPAAERTKGGIEGNVKVTFKDGHSEMWTRRGRCLDAQVSVTGAVGWTRSVGRNSRGGAEGSYLRIIRGGDIKDYRGNGQYVLAWGFCDEGTAVVIKSRARHGRFYLEKYDLRTSHRLGEASDDTPRAELPAWAKPYAEE
jgi:hypothetical protein